MWKNGDFRHIFVVLSAGIKFFSKIGLGHILAIPNTHLSFSKKTEKTNDEISKNAKKTDFPEIFPAFSAGKIIIHIPSHFGHCHFASLCKIS